MDKKESEIQYALNVANEETVYFPDLIVMGKALAKYMNTEAKRVIGLGCRGCSYCSNLFRDPRVGAWCSQGTREYRTVAEFWRRFFIHNSIRIESVAWKRDSTIGGVLMHRIDVWNSGDAWQDDTSLIKFLSDGELTLQDDTPVAKDDSVHV